jgi:hypothetical protein
MRPTRIADETDTVRKGVRVKRRNRKRYAA